MTVLALALFASSQSWFVPDAPAIAAERQVPFTEAQPSRPGCSDIGTSSLRSPAEGLWFQSNCLSTSQARTVSCNRTSLDAAEFRSVAPGLYIYRQTKASYAYLWYASSTECFSLVSSRLVTSVCVDQTITFEWDARAACSGHVGVLALVNGR